MAAIDLNLLGFGIVLAGLGILPAILALRVEHRREARHAARLAQIAAILGTGRGMARAASGLMDHDVIHQTGDKLLHVSCS